MLVGNEVCRTHDLILCSKSDGHPWSTAENTFRKPQMSLDRASRHRVAIGAKVCY